MKRWLVVLLVYGFALPCLPCAGQDAGPTLPAPVNVEALKKLADNGDPIALAGVGDAYFSGIGAGQNLPEALAFYLRAAEKGHTGAAFALACMFHSGLGTSPNQEKALFWATVVSRTPCSEAVKKRLEGILTEVVGNMPPDAVAKTRQEVQDWVIRNESPGQFVPDETLQKKAQGVLKEAEAGNAFAQYKIGNLVFMGFGFPQDYKKAAEWYRKAAEGGYAEAQIALGLLYHQGLGVSQDPAEAYFWLQQGFAEPNINGSQWESFRKLPDQLYAFFSEEEVKAVEKRLQELKAAK